MSYIQVTGGPSTGRFEFTGHPTEHRPICIGDCFAVTSFNDFGTAYWTDWAGRSTALRPSWYRLEENPPCTCDSPSLLLFGCTCGAKS